MQMIGGCTCLRDLGFGSVLGFVSRNLGDLEHIVQNSEDSLGFWRGKDRRAVGRFSTTKSRIFTTEGGG